MCDLGDIYEKGDGAPQDYAEALHYFRMATDHEWGDEWDIENLPGIWESAAALGYAKAQCWFGYTWFNKKDYAQAAVWFRKAAEQGDAEAQSAIGHAYYYGRGVAQDYSEAARWYHLSANQGNAAAQSMLGFMYSHGKGLGEDKAEAVRWYRLAAAQGNDYSQNELGEAYYCGIGVQQDYSDAAPWYRLAAAQGNVAAQFSLGYMYANGQGVPEDKRNPLTGTVYQPIRARPRHSATSAGCMATDRAFHRTPRKPHAGIVWLQNKVTQWHSVCSGCSIIAVTSSF